jgi:hypothetical protein
MAHLIQEYAKNLGVKISNPIVKEHFFPIAFDKYITIYVDNNTSSRNYKHYSVLLFILKPFLQKHNIKIVQLGGTAKIEETEIALNLPFKQQAYLISKSLLHIGCDGVLNHLSSFKKIPTITLFGNTFANVNKPTFSSSSSLNINLEPEWNKKPSFTGDGNDISDIKPEIIAQSIIDLLKLEKCKVNFKTVRIGSSYEQKIVEVIPISFVPINLNAHQELFIRADYGFDEESFVKYCKSYKCSIFLNSLIQPQHLQNFAANVNNLFIFVKKDEDIIPESYFKTLKNLNINVVLFVKNKKDLNYFKNVYFDVPVRLYLGDSSRYKGFNSKNKILSAKRLISQGKEYLSAAHCQKSLDNNNSVIDSDNFFEELEHFYIYEQN